MRSNDKRWTPFPLLSMTFLSVFLPSSVFSGTFDTFGFAAGISKSRAVAASGDRVTAIFHNPAGLAPPIKPGNFHSTSPKYVGGRGSEEGRSGNPRHSLSFGALGGLHHLSSDRHSGLTDATMEDTSESLFWQSLILDLSGIFRSDIPAAFGLIASLPGDGSLMRIDDVNPTVAKFMQYGRSNRHFELVGALGYAIQPEALSVGVGFRFQTGGQGVVRIRQLNLSPDATMPEQQLQMNISPILSPHAGILFTPAEFSFGLSFRRESGLDLSSVRTEVEATLLQAEMTVDTAVRDFYTPDVITAAAGWQFHPLWRAECDGEYQRWSGYRFSAVKAKYSGDPGLSDVISVSCGVDLQMNREVTLMTGAGKRTSAVSAAVLSSAFNMLDAPAWTASFGFQWIPSETPYLRQPLRVSGAVQGQYLPRTSAEKTGSADSYSFSLFTIVTTLSLEITF